MQGNNTSFILLVMKCPVLSWMTLHILRYIVMTVFIVIIALYSWTCSLRVVFAHTNFFLLDAERNHIYYPWNGTHFWHGIHINVWLRNIIENRKTFSWRMMHGYWPAYWLSRMFRELSFHSGTSVEFVVKFLLFLQLYMWCTFFVLSCLFDIIYNLLT